MPTIDINDALELLDQLAYQVMLLEAAYGEDEDDAGTLVESAAANVSTILGLDDEQQAVLLGPARLALAKLRASALYTLLRDLFDALGAHVGGINGYLAARDARVHWALKNLRDDLYHRNTFGPDEIEMGTFSVTAADTGTFTAGARIDTSAYGAVSLRLVTTAAIGSGGLLAHVRCIKSNGQVETKDVAVTGSAPAGTYFNVGDAADRYIGVQSITVTGGTNGDAFEIVAPQERGDLKFTVDAGAGLTITPAVTLDADAPQTLVWDFGDGHTAEGTDGTHTYGAGTFELSIGPFVMLPYITAFDLNGESGISGDLAQFAQCRLLAWLNLGSSGISGNINSLVVLPFIYLNLYQLYVTGGVDSLPATLRNAYINRTSVDAASISTLTSIESISFWQNNWSQAEVDMVIDSIYQNRAAFTHDTPELKIHGSNAEPSGIYRYSANPSTAKEMIFALQHDINGEGFNTWDITYTGEGNDVLVFTVSLPSGGTINPNIVMDGSQPESPLWDFGDSSTAYGSSGVHTYAAGTYTLKIGPNIVLPHISAVHFTTNSAIDCSDLVQFQACCNLGSFEVGGSGFSSGDFGDLPKSITTLRIYATGIEGDLADLPPNVVTIHAWSTAGITGDISNIPSTATSISISGANPTISGNTSNLPADITYVSLSSTSITGDSIGHMLLTSYANFSNCNWTQAEVDAVIDSIYQNRAAFTDATPELFIHGSNAAPSGTYQYSASPSTGKEMIYALENDDDSEGFNKWTITYTA